MINYLMPFFVLGLRALVAAKKAASRSHAGGFVAAGDGDAGRQETDCKGDVFQFPEGRFQGKVGQVEVEELLDEVKEADEGSQPTVDEQGSG